MQKIQIISLVVNPKYSYNLQADT